MNKRIRQSSRAAKFVKYILFFLPIVWAVVVSTALLETYFYPGVLLKHTSVNAIYIYLFFAVFGLFSLYGLEWKTNRLLRIFRKINYFGIWVFGLIYAFFYLLQRFTYPNYVFSTFHIHPPQLSIPFMISIYGYLVSSKNILLKVRKDPKILFRWFPMLVIFTWILAQNLINIGVNVVADFSFMMNNPKASYEQKMKEKIGKQFYEYVLFVKENTPEDSRILIPPFPTSQWPQTGNIPYMTYFLYPRTLLNGEEYLPKYDLRKEKIDYVLIVWGEMQSTVGGHTNGWPKFDVEASRIFYMESDGSKTEKTGKFVYTDVLGKQLWGIIQVKK